MGQTAEMVNEGESPDHVWSYDFLQDRTVCGRRLRILVVIDEYTRECLAMRVAPFDTGLSGDRGSGVAVPASWRAQVPSE